MPEVLQVQPKPEALVAEVRCLLDDRAIADAQVAGFGEIRRLMEQGTAAAPRVDPAERVMRYARG